MRNNGKDRMSIWSFFIFTAGLSIFEVELPGNRLLLPPDRFESLHQRFKAFGIGAVDLASYRQ